VDDALGVRLRQRLQSVPGEPQCVEPIEATDASQTVTDRFTFQHFHRQEPRAVLGFTKVESGDGVWTDERANRARLAFESAFCFGIVRAILAHEFERDVATHCLLARAIHGAHRASAQAAENRKPACNGSTEQGVGSVTQIDEGQRMIRATR
jgi:hypothetical protein